MIKNCPNCGKPINLPDTFETGQYNCPYNDCAKAFFFNKELDTIHNLTEPPNETSPEKIIIICPNPKCQQQLALPISNSRLSVTCPKCKFEFFYPFETKTKKKVPPKRRNSNRTRWYNSKWAMKIVLFLLLLGINNIMKFAFPLVFFTWSLFRPVIASYVFISIVTLFVVYLFIIDIIGKPNPDSSFLNTQEIETLRKYHLAIRFPYGARDFSCLLNGIRWSSFIWVPWLLWNRLWIPSVVLVTNFFLTASLSVRLDPFFFLSDAVNRGQNQFLRELMILQKIKEKLNVMIDPPQNTTPHD